MTIQAWQNMLDLGKWYSEENLSALIDHALLLPGVFPKEIFPLCTEV